jgi:hypothetical protein
MGMEWLDDVQDMVFVICVVRKKEGRFVIPVIIRCSMSMAFWLDVSSATDCIWLNFI